MPCFRKASKKSLPTWSLLHFDTQGFQNSCQRPFSSYWTDLALTRSANSDIAPSRPSAKSLSGTSSVLFAPSLFVSKFSLVCKPLNLPSLLCIDAREVSTAQLERNKFYVTSKESLFFERSWPKLRFLKGLLQEPDGQLPDGQQGDTGDTSEVRCNCYATTMMTTLRHVMCNRHIMVTHAFSQ